MVNICSTCKNFVKFLGDGYFVMCSRDHHPFKLHDIRPVAEKLTECDSWKVCNEQRTDC